MDNRFTKKIMHHFHEVIKLKTTPHSIAVGFAIGTFISILPTPGFNIMLGLLLILIFERISKLSLFGAILFWNPIVSIPIYWLNHKVGDLLFGSALDIKYNIVFVDFIYNFSRKYLIGSLINGIIISLLCYFLVWFIASKYNKNKEIKEKQQKILMEQKSHLIGDNMTETLFLDNSYLKEWDAKVISVKNSDKSTFFITLDKTAFYPNSGGQPHDEGIITKKSDNNKFKVVFVGKFPGEISHEVSNKNEDETENEHLKEGDEVTCKLNWERRYKLMRTHTATHILCGIIHKECGAMITGNQLGIDKTRIDFSVDEYDPEKLKEYIKRTNKVMKEGHDIEIYYVDKNKDLDKFMRLAKGIPENITKVRIIDIKDVDAQPDGGTHVKNTKEVGNLKFLKSENKGKNNRRMYFELE